MAVKRSTKVRKNNKEESSKEPAWNFRGEEINSSDLTTAIGQIFSMAGKRAGEFHQRLDTTTNWAIILTSATISLAFSQPSVHHAVIIIEMLLVLWFLSIEAGRYRNYELWNHRVRYIENDFYMAMIVPPFHSSPKQLEILSERLLIPHYPVSIWEAYGRRLRQRYLLIFTVLSVSWIAKIWLFPTPAHDVANFISRAAVGTISPLVIMSMGLFLYISLVLIVVFTNPRIKAVTNVLPSLQKGRSSVLIATNKPEAISALILADFGQKATALDGSKVYFGTGRTVLKCTLIDKQIEELKESVVKEDHQAFVIISPRKGLLGQIFNPLEDE